MSARHDPYKDVAIATRAAYARLRVAECFPCIAPNRKRDGDGNALPSQPLQPIHRRVFDAVVELIPLYSRRSDTIGMRQLAELVYEGRAGKIGWQRDRVTRALRELGDAGVIDVEIGAGHVARTRVTFPEASAFAQGCLDLLDPEASAFAQDSEAEPCANAESTQRVRAANPARRVGHSEKYPEKTSEERDALLKRATAHFTAGNRRVTVTEVDDALTNLLSKMPLDLVARALDASIHARDNWPSELRRRALELQTSETAADRNNRAATHPADCHCSGTGWIEIPSGDAVVACTHERTEATA